MSGSHPTAYARRLGLFDATMLVIGGIVGAGIFLNPTVVAQRVPTPGLALSAWVLGGIVALAGAVCFAELGARRPYAGGGYVYLRDAFGPLPAFLYGWTQLLVINSGGIAAVAITFARYVAALGGWPSGFSTPIAVGAVVFLSAVNYFGIRPGAIVQNVFTVLKMLALAGLIVAGFGLAAPATATTAPALDLGPAGIVRVTGVALVPVLFAYGGWQSTNFVAEELRRPARDLPRALVLGVAGVVTTYVLANAVYLRVLGLDGLAASSAPASDVMERLAGRVGATAITVGIVISTFGFLNLAILASPRMYQAMAADGVFVRAAATLHPRHRVPATALFIQGAWAIVLLSTKTYERLLDYVVFADWIFFGLVGATVMYFRRREGEAELAFRSPGYPWVPLFFVATAGFTVVSTVRSNVGDAALGAALIVAGIPAFLIWRTRERRRSQEQRP